MSKDTLVWLRDDMQRKLSDVDPAGYVSLYEVETWRDAVGTLLRERESAKAAVTDEIRAHASFIYRKTTDGNCNELGMLNALEAIAPMLASARVPDGLSEILKELKRYASYIRNRFAISTQARVSCDDMIALVERGLQLLAAAPKP